MVLGGYYGIGWILWYWVDIVVLGGYYGIGWILWYWVDIMVLGGYYGIGSTECQGPLR